MFARLPGKLYYGWVVVAVTFATSLVTAGIRSTPALFIYPLEVEFGWNRAAIATAVSINLLLMGLAAPISGRLIDRHGPRGVMLGSLSLLSLGVAGSLLMRDVWQFDLLWGVFVGLGAGGSGTVVFTAVASRWFVARRGMVLGFMGTANSTGQLVFLPLLMAIVVAFGWRGAATVMAVLALAMLVPVLLWMRNDPAEKGLQPYGAEQPGFRTHARDEAPTVPLTRAVQAPEFWLLAGSMFTCGATANGLIGTHLIPHSIDHGIPEVAAAATLGVMGAMNFVGTMASGWLTDRVDARRLLAVVFGLRGLSLLVLPFVADFSGLMVFAVIYGLDWYATIPPVVALVASRFGKRSVASIYGWLFLSHQLGGAISATAGGAVRVWLGDYQMAFLAGGVLAMLGACMALLVRDPRVRRALPTASPAAA